MKKIILAAALTLLMLSPAQAAGVSCRDGAFLVASARKDQGQGGHKDGHGDRQPLMVIIKGKGGKVTGVVQEPPGHDKGKKK